MVTPTPRTAVHMEPLSALLLTLLLWVAHCKGEIRCYCNDASCVRTGYMCKSSIGTCFSQLTYEGDTARSVHGCVDLLPDTDKQLCEGEGDIIRTRNDHEEWPILMCCKDDMCNYMDNLDINIYVNTKSNNSILKGSDTIHRGTHTQSDHDRRYISEASSHQRELWFKAAVIAVPIAGGFILVLLVLLAVRMLRTDTQRHRQLMAMRHHRSLTKAHLYVADHFCEKGERNSHLICPEKSSNIYKDVNIKMDHDGCHGYEKIRNSSVHGGSCNSVLIWGKAPPIDGPATLV